VAFAIVSLPGYFRIHPVSILGQVITSQVGDTHSLLFPSPVETEMLNHGFSFYPFVSQSTLEQNNALKKRKSIRMGMNANTGRPSGCCLLRKRPEPDMTAPPEWSASGRGKKDQRRCKFIPEWHRQ
jgi:hypothetical protein